MAEAVETLDGWYCLHDLRSIDWKAWKKLSDTERHEAIQEFNELFSEWEQVEAAKKGSQVMYNALGHKADLMFMFLRETTEELSQIETKINKSKLGDFLIREHSYFSVVEMSKYRYQNSDVDPETLPEVQERLYPILPKWKHMSFYPMKRRRIGDENWYRLDIKERSKLLYEHSLTGRQYVDKVKQVTTGSIGFDLWEWGITLFSDDVLQLKKIVYEMRFDEASSKYGEFGDFYVGNYLAKEDLATFLKIEA